MYKLEERMVMITYWYLFRNFKHLVSCVTLFDLPPIAARHCIPRLFPLQYQVAGVSRSLIRLQILEVQFLP